MSATKALLRQLRDYSNQCGYWPPVWFVGPRTYRAVCREMDATAGHCCADTVGVPVRWRVINGTELHCIGGKP